jgi:uncharacterized protein YbjT (DUF2867 family)
MASTKQKVAVFGATGRQGGAVARELLANGWPVRAVTRHTDSAAAKELARLGAEVVFADLDDAESLKKAVSGAWGLFAVQNTWEAGVEREEEQGKRLAKIAKDAGIQHIVYTSVGSAERNTGIPHFDNKWRIEETIRGLGFPSHVILRPVFFMENLASPMFLPALQSGTLPMGIQPGTVLQMISVRDIGKYGLWAFEKAADLNGRGIELAGDALTMPQTAKRLSDAMHREVKFFQVPIEEARKFSEDWAKMLEWFDAVGYAADIPRNAQESGIRPTTFAEWASTVDWSVPAETR